MKKLKNILTVAIILSLSCSQAFAHQHNEDIELNEHHHHCDCEASHNHKLIEVKDGSVLSIRDCISVGVKNSPIIKEYAHKLELAKSNVGLAKSAYFPELSAQAGYHQEFNSNQDDFYRNYRTLPTVGVALNKMIWDFGKTSANIRMEEFLKIAAEYEFEDSVCSTVFDIKMKYYDFLRAEAQVNVDKTNIDLQEQFIKKMKSLVSSNKKNKSDLANAETELTSAKMQLISAEDELKNAKENLNNSMYLLNAPSYSIYETQTFKYDNQLQSAFKNVSLKKTHIIADDTTFQHPHFTYSEAVELAYKNSPDLKVLVATKDAMEQSLLFIKRSYYPELAGGVTYDYLNSNKYSNNGLGVNVNVSSSLNAMRQKYDVKGGMEQLNLAQNEIEKFKENLYFRVRKAVNIVNKTQEEIPLSQQKVKEALKNLELVNLGYESGKNNQLELQNARNLYYLALGDNVKAQYEYNIALINLEMSMHYHMIDYHDDAEHAIEFHEQNVSNTLSELVNCKKKHKP